MTDEQKRILQEQAQYAAQEAPINTQWELNPTKQEWSNPTWNMSTDRGWNTPDMSRFYLK